MIPIWSLECFSCDIAWICITCKCYNQVKQHHERNAGTAKRTSPSCNNVIFHFKSCLIKSKCYHIKQMTSQCCYHYILHVYSSNPSIHKSGSKLLCVYPTAQSQCVTEIYALKWPAADVVSIAATTVAFLLKVSTKPPVHPSPPSVRCACSQPAR